VLPRSVELAHGKIAPGSVRRQIENTHSHDTETKHNPLKANNGNTAKHLV